MLDTATAIILAEKNEFGIFAHARRKYKSPNYVVSRVHINYLQHCGLFPCCTQSYYREINCEKVSS